MAWRCSSSSSRPITRVRQHSWFGDLRGLRALGWRLQQHQRISQPTVQAHARSAGESCRLAGGLAPSQTSSITLSSACPRPLPPLAAALYQYFLKVVPTSYSNLRNETIYTNQFRCGLCCVSRWQLRSRMRCNLHRGCRSLAGRCLAPPQTQPQALRTFVCQAVPQRDQTCWEAVSPALATLPRALLPSLACLPCCPCPRRSVTEHFRETASPSAGGGQLPGVFLFYDLSPIKVRSCFFGCAGRRAARLSFSPPRNCWPVPCHQSVAPMALISSMHCVSASAQPSLHAGALPGEPHLLPLLPHLPLRHHRRRVHRCAVFAGPSLLARGATNGGALAELAACVLACWWGRHLVNPSVLCPSSLCSERHHRCHGVPRAAGNQEEDGPWKAELTSTGQQSAAAKGPGSGPALASRRPAGAPCQAAALPGRLLIAPSLPCLISSPSLLLPSPHLLLPSPAVRSHLSRFACGLPPSA